MTIAMLLGNTMRAAALAHGLPTDEVNVA
jgi:hypothetical protein